ncbi:MAG: PilZ domain-containing protein [Terriglobales bacterium]
MAAVSPSPFSGAGATPEAHYARLLLITFDDALGGDFIIQARLSGFDCDVCQLHQALPFLAGGAYDAVLVDVADATTGIPFIEELRRQGTTRQIPVAVVADAVVLQSAFRSGASFGIPRPVTSDLLKNTLAAMYRIAIGQRRQYARYPVELPLVMTIKDTTMEAKATDVGYGGLALVAPIPLEKGTSVTVRFTLSGFSEPIIAVGEIRWTDHQGRAGLCFTTLAGAGSPALDSWIARRHAGTPDPEPAAADAPVAPCPRLASSAEAAADPARRTGRLLLGIVLFAFCLFVIGFWIYVATTS